MSQFVVGDRVQLKKKQWAIGWVTAVEGTAVTVLWDNNKETIVHEIFLQWSKRAPTMCESIEHGYKATSES